MKKIFERLSGRPKNGNIIECMRPYITIPQTIIAIIIMIYAIKTDNIIGGLISLLLTWQIGWGMSVERFMQYKKKKTNNLSEDNIVEDEINPLDVSLSSPIYEEETISIQNNRNISRLKPCPKCGGEGRLDIGYDNEKVVCKQCGAKTKIFFGDYYDEGFMNGNVATKWWNRGEVYETVNKLKPCPKCGGDGKLNIGYDTEEVVCSKCGAKTKIFFGDYCDHGYMDGEVAKRRWNNGEVFKDDIQEIKLIF